LKHEELTATFELENIKKEAFNVSIRQFFTFLLAVRIILLLFAGH